MVTTAQGADVTGEKDANGKGSSEPARVFLPQGGDLSLATYTDNPFYSTVLSIHKRDVPTLLDSMDGEFAKHDWSEEKQVFAALRECVLRTFMGFDSDESGYLLARAVLWLARYYGKLDNMLSKDTETVTAVRLPTENGGHFLIEYLSAQHVMELFQRKERASNDGSSDHAGEGGFDSAVATLPVGYVGKPHDGRPRMSEGEASLCVLLEMPDAALPAVSVAVPVKRARKLARTAQGELNNAHADANPIEYVRDTIVSMVEELESASSALRESGMTGTYGRLSSYTAWLLRHAGLLERVGQNAEAETVRVKVPPENSTDFKFLVEGTGSFH